RRRHHRLAADRRALRRAARARALTDRGAEPRRGGGPARRPGGGPGAARRAGRRAPAARLRALPGRPGRPAAAARQAPRGGGRLPRGARLGRHRTGARPPAATPGRPHLPLHRSGAGGWGEHPRSEAGRPHVTCPSPFSPPPEAGKNTLGQEAIIQRRGRDMVRPVEERYRAVRDLFPELRIELVNGRIVVNEPGTWQHNTIIAQLLAQLAPLVAERGWEIWPNITVHLDEETDRYVPDLTIVPREPAMATDQAVRGTSTLLLVDVVSAGNAYDDHVVKPMGYAPAGVPLYLVVDPFQQLLKLHSEPEPSGYARETVEPVGAPLPLPDPWDCLIDTSGLLRI